MPWEKPPLRRLSLPTCTTVRSKYEENRIGRYAWLKGDEDLLQGNVWYGGLMLSIHNERLTFGCCCRLNFKVQGNSPREYSIFGSMFRMPSNSPANAWPDFSSIDASILQYRKGSLEHDDHRFYTKYPLCSRIVAPNIPRRSQLTKPMKAYSILQHL